MFLLHGDISQCLVLGQIIQIEINLYAFWSLAISRFATTWELRLAWGHVNFIQSWIVPGIFDLALQGGMSMKRNLTMANSEVSVCICVIYMQDKCVHQSNLKFYVTVKGILFGLRFFISDLDRKLLLILY